MMLLAHAGFIIRDFHAHEQFPAISIIYFSTTTSYLGTNAVGIDYRGNILGIDNPCKYVVVQFAYHTGPFCANVVSLLRKSEFYFFPELHQPSTY